MDVFQFKTIAIARTPYNEKFGIPRQAGLVDVPGVIELQAPYNVIEAVNGLEQVSHIWLHFVFSQHVNAEPKLSVRPPRLGGNKKLGVFATRSSYRPNSLGQSLVKLESIQKGKQGVELHVSGIDLLDGTPIIDIKPYLPYADIEHSAVNELANSAPDDQCLLVSWQENATKQLREIKAEQCCDIKRWVSEIIQFDPRPAYKANEINAEYGMTVFDMNIRWSVVSINTVEIIHIEKMKVEDVNVKRLNNSEN